MIDQFLMKEKDKIVFLINYRGCVFFFKAKVSIYKGGINMESISLIKSIKARYEYIYCIMQSR